MTPCDPRTQRLESYYTEVLDMYNECSDGITVRQFSLKEEIIFG